MEQRGWMHSSVWCVVEVCYCELAHLQVHTIDTNMMDDIDILLY